MDDELHFFPQGQSCGWVPRKDLGTPPTVLSVSRARPTSRFHHHGPRLVAAPPSGRFAVACPRRDGRAKRGGAPFLPFLKMASGSLLLGGQPMSSCRPMGGYNT